MKNLFYVIMIALFVVFSGNAMANQNAPLTQEEMFDFGSDVDEEATQEPMNVPMVVDKATGEVLIEELLYVQIIGGGVAILTYVEEGNFVESEMSWSEIKVLTTDNQECNVPDLVHVQCPGLEQWNELVMEGLGQ